MKARQIVIALACLFFSWTSASALVLGLDERRSAEIYAARKHAKLSLLRQSFAASGIVVCGSAKGAGQLVLARDIIVTAAHVLFDHTGNPRSEKCEFVIENEGFVTTREFFFSSVVAGSSRPYQEPPSADWAVAKLSRPIVKVTPYALDSNEQRDVTLVSKGHQDWRQGTQTAYQDCRLELSGGTSTRGVKELRSDCDTGDGASGGGFFVTRTGVPSLVGILVGWRSEEPVARRHYSQTNYNLAISVSGRFEEAIIAMDHSPQIASTR